MPKIIDLNEQKFGRLTVLKFAKKVKRKTHWLCKCDCGNERVVYSGHLKNGHTQSCGCYMKERSSEANIKHGQNRSKKPTSEYKTWIDIKYRCSENAADNNFKSYYGKGIRVCERWINSFENFFEDMGKKPSPKHSIDRINNDGNYEPSNCKWSTNREQARNKSTNRWIEANGEKMVLRDWESKLNIDRHKIYYWLKRNKTFQEIVDAIPI